MRRMYIALFGLCLLFCLTGCASRISRDLPAMTTLAQFEASFGPPQKTAPREDGTVVYEWGFDNTAFEPGQYVTQRIYMGHDRDGYRKYYEREVWVPAHRSGRFCQVRVVADQAGRVLHSAYHGNDCDPLFRADSVR